jgi:hypothetical protein
MKTNYYQYQKPKLHEDTIQSSSGRTYTKSEVKLIILQQGLYHKDVHIKKIDRKAFYSRNSNCKRKCRSKLQRPQAATSRIRDS